MDIRPRVEDEALPKRKLVVPLIRCCENRESETLMLNLFIIFLRGFLLISFLFFISLQRSLDERFRSRFL